jgi:hypothetical protein
MTASKSISRRITSFPKTVSEFIEPNRRREQFSDSIDPAFLEEDTEGRG